MLHRHASCQKASTWTLLLQQWRRQSMLCWQQCTVSYQVIHHWSAAMILTSRHLCVQPSSFDDALRSLDRLTGFDFDLPVDLAVRQLQNIKDAFWCATTPVGEEVPLVSASSGWTFISLCCAARANVRGQVLVLNHWKHVPFYCEYVVQNKTNVFMRCLGAAIDVDLTSTGFRCEVFWFLHV